MFTDRPGPVDHMVAGAKLAESHTLHSTMQPGGGGGSYQTQWNIK